MNIAILITLLRVLLLPIIIILHYQHTGFASLIAVLLFFLIILSDMFDGVIARRRHEITRFGSVLDPLSDKLIIYVLLLIFALEENLLWIILLVFIFRDFVVNYSRFIAAKNDLEIKEYSYRKIKAIFQYTLILLLLFVLQNCSVSLLFCLFELFYNYRFDRQGNNLFA